MADERLSKEKQDARRNRVAMGVGVGGGLSVTLTIIVGSLYKDVLGREMDPEFAMAVGALLGSFASTFAICVRDIRDMVWAVIQRRNQRRSGDAGKARS